MGMVVIKNAQVVLENVIIWDGGIVIEDDKIVNADKIGNIEIPYGAEVIDATKNPAETIGIYNKKGSLSVGKTADIVILNKDLTIKNVILRGKLLS